jgi:thiosulfate dehydrogenase (quinone) large subunit
VRTAAIVRILTGVLFVAEGLSKISGHFVRGGFAGPLGGIAASSFPFWRQFLETVVVPRAGFFAWVVALGELAVGVGLLVGFLTRIAAGGGALLMLAIALGQARPGPGASWDDWITSGLTPKLALLLLVLLCAVDPGKIWGLDARRRGLRTRLRAAD